MVVRSGASPAFPCPVRLGLSNMPREARGGGSRLPVHEEQDQRKQQQQEEELADEDAAAECEQQNDDQQEQNHGCWSLLSEDEPNANRRAEPQWPHLLLEPGGVESFVLAPEGAPPDRLPVTPFVGQPHRPFNRRTAPCAPPANAPARERPVSEVSYLVDLCHSDRSTASGACSGSRR